MPKVTQAHIEAAQEAVAAVPFNSWPNNEIKAGIIQALEALAFDCDDPRRSRELAGALVMLQKELAYGLAREFERAKSTASHVKYNVDQKVLLTSEIDDPDAVLMEASKTLEARRWKQDGERRW